MARLSTLSVVTGLAALTLGCSGIGETRLATVTCKPYEGPKIEQTIELGEEGKYSTQVMVDTVCRAESDRGTAVGYLDSTQSWRGYSNPSGWTTRKLPNEVSGRVVQELPILKIGKRPCTPNPSVIGLDPNDGWLAKYHFEGK